MKWLKRILIGLVALLFIAIVGFWAWATIGAQEPGALAQAALSGGDGVSVISMDGDGFILKPDSPTDIGFVFYSGGLVEPEAYAAHLRPIAEAGHTVFAPKMLLNLAVFNLSAADDIITDHPEIEHWVIGGHSLGGAMAAQYTLNNDDKIDGLVLWASFPADGADLSNFDIEVVSIFGSNDGLATTEEIRGSGGRLPADTVFAEITEGNHAQFGDYGEQSGDNPASIPLENQINETANQTLLLIESIRSP